MPHSEDNVNEVYQLVASIISLIVITFIIIFFHKNLFYPIHKKCHVQWWGFGVFLYIVAIIYFFVAIVMIVLSSIAISNKTSASRRRQVIIKKY